MAGAALAIHILTAFGGVCAFEALLAFVAQAPQTGFLWLGLALIVDGVDGPLARRLEVKRHAPHISGEVLDLVVDYLTYVFVPVVALVMSGHLAGPLGHVLSAGIVLSALIYFADRRMKDPDNRFVGFPALWNVVAFYVIALSLSPRLSALVVALAIALTFVPLRWVHPLRVREFRSLTIAVTVAWAAAGLEVLAASFPASGWSRLVLLGALFYWLALTAFWSARDGAAR